MEILSTGNYHSPWFIVFAILIFITFVMILFSCDSSSKWMWLFTCILALVSSIMLYKAITDYGRITYKVILRDMTYEQLVEKYDIIDQDGEIIEIVEKKNDTKDK